jgi:hypothetical protein
MKLDVLGPWDQPIREAVQAGLPGSKPYFTPLPQGKAGLVVSWPGFSGLNVPERQEMVRDAIAPLGRDAGKRVTLIFALTPSELLGSQDP